MHGREEAATGERDRRRRTASSEGDGAGGKSRRSRGGWRASRGRPPQRDNELDQKLAQLRDEVSNSRVPEARAMVKELEARWPESERGQHWARVLAPPVVVPTTGPDPRSRPLDRERAWLREHGREYPGCWLAVYEDRLIAANPDLSVVLMIADQTPEDQHALLYQEASRG